MLKDATEALNGDGKVLNIDGEALKGEGEYKSNGEPFRTKKRPKRVTERPELQRRGVKLKHVQHEAEALKGDGKAFNCKEEALNKECYRDA